MWDMKTSDEIRPADPVWQEIDSIRRARGLGIDRDDLVPRLVQRGERRDGEGRRSHEDDAHKRWA